MEGVKLERAVKAPGLESRRAGHAVLPQWRCTARPMVVNLTADGDGDAIGEGMHGSVYLRLSMGGWMAEGCCALGSRVLICFCGCAVGWQ